MSLCFLVWVKNLRIFLCKFEFYFEELYISTGGHVWKLIMLIKDDKLDLCCVCLNLIMGLEQPGHMLAVASLLMSSHLSFQSPAQTIAIVL